VGCAGLVLFTSFTSKERARVYKGEEDGRGRSSILLAAALIASVLVISYEAKH